MQIKFNYHNVIIILSIIFHLKKQKEKKRKINKKYNKKKVNCFKRYM